MHMLLHILSAAAVSSVLVFLVARYPAKIMEVDDRDMTVLIHFDGWNQRYDEWVKMTSDQLRPLAEASRLKKEIPRTKSVCSACNCTYNYTYCYLISKSPLANADALLCSDAVHLFVCFYHSSVCCLWNLLGYLPHDSTWRLAGLLVSSLICVFVLTTSF